MYAERDGRKQKRERGRDGKGLREEEGREGRVSRGRWEGSVPQGTPSGSTHKGEERKKKIGDKKRIRRERKKGGKEVREGMRAKEEGFSP